MKRQLLLLFTLIIHAGTYKAQAEDVSEVPPVCQAIVDGLEKGELYFTILAGLNQMGFDTTDPVITGILSSSVNNFNSANPKKSLKDCELAVQKNRGLLVSEGDRATFSQGADRALKGAFFSEPSLWSLSLDNVFMAHEIEATCNRANEICDDNLGQIIPTQTLNTFGEIKSELKFSGYTDLMDFKQGSRRTKAGLRLMTPEDSLFSETSKFGQFCKCLGDINSTSSSFISNQMQEKSKVQDLILKEIGKKVLNDYSVNLENSSYFVHTGNGRLFGSNKTEQEENAIRGQCVDPERYMKRIKVDCAKSGVPEAEQVKRLNIFLNSLDHEVKGQNLKEKFASLNDTILSLPIPGTKNSYGRKTFDQERRVILKDKLDDDFIDQAIVGILKDSKTKERLYTILSSYGHPMYAIKEIFLKEYADNKNAFFKKYLNERTLGKKFVADAKKQLANNPDEFIHKMLVFSKKLHPGIDILLSDVDVLKSTAEKIKKGQSIQDFLERDPLLADRFEEKCDKLVDDVAMGVCLPSSDLVSRMNPSDLKKLLQRNPDKESDPDVRNSIICDSFAVHSDPLLNEASKGPWAANERSDLLIRQSENKESFFETLMKESTKNPEFRHTMGRVAAVTSGQGRGIRSSLIPSNQFSRDVDDLFSPSGKYASPESRKAVLNNRTPSSVPESVTSFQNGEANQEGGSDPKAQNYSQMASVVPMQPFSTSPKSDLREEVRKVLSNRENKESVDRLISNTDEKTLKDLMTLREEAARNKEKLLALTSENERLKLKELESKIKELEERKAKINSEKAMETQATEEVVKESPRSLKDTFRDPGRDAVPSHSSETSGSASGKFPDRSPVSEVAYAANAIPFKSSGKSNLGTSGYVDKSVEGVIILSSAARTSEIQTQELGQELISYLSQMDADMATLQKLKTSGMVYKYQVLENGRYVEKEVIVDYKTLTDDVKKVIEQKIASKTALSGQEIESELQMARRTYSYAALKIILGEQMKK